MSIRVLFGRPFVLVQVDKSVTTSRLRAVQWLVTTSLTEALRMRPSSIRPWQVPSSSRTYPGLGMCSPSFTVTSKVVYVAHGAHLVELADTEIVVDGVVVNISAGMGAVLAYLVDSRGSTSAARSSPTPRHWTAVLRETGCGSSPSAGVDRDR